MYLNSLVSLVWYIRQQFPDDVYGLWGSGGLEDAAPGIGADLRELKLLVVGVHALQFVLSWGSQHLGKNIVRYIKII